MPSHLRYALCVTTLLTGLAGQALADPGDIIFARAQDADALDVHRVSSTISFQVMNQMYDNLVNLNEKGEVVAGLAASYTASPDAKTFTFTVRNDLKCHDGSSFNAQAAKWNIDRAINPATGSPNASSYGSITSTKVEGDVLTVTLADSYSPLPTFLANPLSLMMCPSSVVGEDFKPVGTGPWKFGEWLRNDRIVLERNDHYVNVNPLIENPAAPHARRLIFRVIPEGPSRMAALATGEVNFAEPSLQDAATLAQDPGYKVYTGAGRTGQLGYMGFTTRIPPLDNVNVRRAIGYAVDRDAMVDIGFNGLVESATCPVAPGLVGYDPEKCAKWATSYNPEKAKELLAGAGYGPDRPLDVIFSVSPLQGWDESTVLMQQQLAAVGVNAKIEQRQFATWVDFMTTKQKETSGTPAIWTMGMSGNDADYLAFLFQLPGFAGQGIDDPDLQRMLVEQRALTGEARTAKVLEIQELLLTKAYEIPLFSPGWFWLAASKSDITGFKQAYMVQPLFNDVKLPE